MLELHLLAHRFEDAVAGALEPARRGGPMHEIHAPELIDAAAADEL
jgi:hypothetical protein